MSVGAQPARIPSALERRLGPNGRRFESKSPYESLQPGYILSYRRSKDWMYPVIRVMAYGYLSKTYGLLRGDIAAVAQDSIRLWRQRRRENFQVAFDEVVRRLRDHAQTAFRVEE